MYSNNILPSHEADRAYQFAKSKQRQTNSTGNSQRLSQIDEELSYWKQRLLGAPIEQRQTIADRLIKLRAEQTTIILANLHTEKTAVENERAKKIIVHYYHDCFRLLHAIKTI
jgi:hypothetical protein